MIQTDEIFNLISKDNSINTFNNNIELFQNFYFNIPYIKLNTKVIEIFKYLLKLNINDDYNFPTLYNNIGKKINDYIDTIAFNFHRKDNIVNNDTIQIFEIAANWYYELKPLDSNNVLYSEKIFTREITSAMILALNKSFFELSNENILMLLNNIKNNMYIESQIKNTNFNLLDKDYLFQYLTRFLFNQEFIDIDYYEDDLLLKSILDGDIKDIKFFEKCIKHLNENIILDYYENDLSKFTNALNLITDDLYYKKAIFNIVYNKIDKNFDNCTLVMLDFIMDEKNDEYLFENEKQDILKKIVDNYTAFNDKQINYILDNYHEHNELLLFNLKSNLENNNWSEITIQRVKEKTKNIKIKDLTYEESIKTIDNLFKDKKPNIYDLMISLKTICMKFLNIDTLTLFVTINDNYNGCIDSNNIIQLNYNIIKKLLLHNNLDNDPKLLHIFNTLFHEATHYIQFNKDIDINTISDTDYENYKETVLVNLLTNYYEDNYEGISYEKEARVMGAYHFFNFIKEYFPYMNNSITYYEKQSKEENEKVFGDKKIFELGKEINIDIVLEKLILINPSIIAKYPLLEKEYNKDGTKKGKKAYGG